MAMTKSAVLGCVVGVAGCLLGCGAELSDERAEVAQSPLENDTGCLPLLVAGSPVANPHRLTLREGAGYEGMTDTTLSQRGPNGPLGDWVYCRAKGGRDSSSCLLRWELSAVPPDTQVARACLVVEVADASVRTFAVKELSRGWDEAEATWKRATRATKWSAPGARGSNDWSEQASASLAPRTGTQVIELPPQMVQRWITTPSSNHGLALDNPASHDGMSLISSEVPDVELRPALILLKEP